MKKKRYSEEQIIKAIKEHEAGIKVEDICRDLGISNGTFYNWRSKYAGLEVNEAKRLRELESENNKLKKLLAEKLLENEAMSAAPSNVSSEATIIDSTGKVLREGSNDWTCMPGTPPNENVNPMCVDQAWQKWLQAFMAQTPYDSENESFGTSYMLVGDQAIDNDDPFNLDRSKGTWIKEGPHLMLLLPESLMNNLPTDPYAGGPYVMFKGTDFVHVMVPLETTEPLN